MSSPSSQGRPAPDTLLGLYRTMLHIRMLELRIEDEYAGDLMYTPVHLCIGQEAVAAGACAPLRQDDYISSNHRSHGHYLAKGGDLAKLVAELHGRTTGCSKGHGGSMHVAAPEVGHLGSSSIVGGGIPIGVGQGFASKALEQGRVSLIFFGDGAANEGVLYESVNFALLKRLPVIFLYENNQYSVCSRASDREACENIYHFLPEDVLPSRKVDGNDVVAVYTSVAEAVNRARSGDGPSFIECVTYRVRGHHGPGSDADAGYRTREEIASWEARCPVGTFRQVLCNDGVLTAEAETRMCDEISAELDEAFAFAKASPEPVPDDVHRHVFRE